MNEIVVPQEFAAPIPAHVAPTRDQIMAFQNAMIGMRDAGMPMVDGDARTGHYFAPGLYAREFRMLENEVVVGKIHRHAHLTMLVYGTATVASEFGNETITGPHVFVSKVGVKRVVWSHTECLFMTFHPTDETDLKKIEDEVIAESYEQVDACKQIAEVSQ